MDEEFSDHKIHESEETGHDESQDTNDQHDTSAAPAKLSPDERIAFAQDSVVKNGLKSAGIMSAAAAMIGGVGVVLGGAAYADYYQSHNHHVVSEAPTTSAPSSTSNSVSPSGKSPSSAPKAKESKDAKSPTSTGSPSSKSTEPAKSNAPSSASSEPKQTPSDSAATRPATPSVAPSQDPKSGNGSVENGPSSSTDKEKSGNNSANGGMTNDGTNRTNHDDSVIPNVTDSHTAGGWAPRGIDSNWKSHTHVDYRGRTLYKVQYGDTLSQLAKSMGVSQEALAKANGITNPDLIFENQNLVVPGMQH